MGVTFVTGPSGTAREVLYGPNGKAIGITAVDGTQHRAEKVVLACGAWMDSIIDTKAQCLAKW